VEIDILYLLAMTRLIMEIVISSVTDIVVYPDLEHHQVIDIHHLIIYIHHPVLEINSEIEIVTHMNIDPHLILGVIRGFMEMTAPDLEYQPVIDIHSEMKIVVSIVDLFNRIKI